MSFALPDIDTENRLLARAQRGDQAAISEIYERYFSSLYRFIRLHVDETQLAEDISAEVFLKFVDTVGKRNGPQHTLRGWLFRVARHDIYRHWDKLQHLHETALEESLPMMADSDLEAQFIRSLDTERAQQALQMLSPDQRAVLILRFAEALSLQETADIMGKGIAAVKSLQFRAISTLRGILGEIRTEQYG
jgi:RNA polymerase sigma-70 factor, ECF subfamily